MHTILKSLAVLALAGGVAAVSARAQTSKGADEVKKLSIEQLHREFDRRSGGIGGRDNKTARPPRDIEQMSRAEFVRAARTAFDPKTIYGPDDRKDFGEVREGTIRTLMQSTVALFDRSGELKVRQGQSAFKAETLRESQGLCEAEKFGQQVAGAFCSGSLIAADRVLTAGHCVRDVSHKSDVPFAEGIAFVFGYHAKDGADRGPSNFPDPQVFYGTEVVAGELATSGADWAVVKLDRPVPETLARPLTKISSKKAEKGMGVFVIGYPTGLPSKYAPNAEVRAADKSAYFVANLDTFGGNSGSPVFETGSNALIGVLVRGDTDYVFDKDKGCKIANVCPTTGCRGEDVTRISIVQLN